MSRHRSSPVSKEVIQGYIKKYFHMGCTHVDILALLRKNHQINISHSTLKRELRDLRLKRKNVAESNIGEICSAVKTELQSCGYNLGYRGLHHKLLHKHKLTVKRDTAYFLLRVADPNGIETRLARRLKRRTYRSKGPNFVWHIDGYDKLKPFGFSIHAGIDGFSRKIMWLELGTTNKDPKVTAYYYLNTVRELGLLPAIIRSDAGTENVIIHTMHTCLRAKHEDDLAGPKSFRVGKSTHNQRIEAFWGQLRKHSMGYYIELFKDMKDRGLFNGTDGEIECLQFCFSHVIKADLDDTKMLWNKHRIRNQKGIDQNDRPYVMYHLPEKFGAVDCKKTVNLAAVNRLLASEQYVKKQRLYEESFFRRAYAVLPDLTIPTNAKEAFRLYKRLRTLLNL